jgi:hypothetical protein
LIAQVRNLRFQDCYRPGWAMGAGCKVTLISKDLGTTELQLDPQTPRFSNGSCSNTDGTYAFYRPS